MKHIPYAFGRWSVLFLATTVLACSQLLPQPLPQNNVRIQRTQRLTKPDTVVIASPNHNERPPQTAISTVVLHHTAMAGNARQVAAFFANPQAGVSSHYVIDRSGEIIQPVPDGLRAWHAGKSEFNGISNVNDFSIGIEICNLGDGSDPYPDTQYDAIIRLVAFLVETYQIPAVHITRHRDVAIPKGRKVDTSDNFSVARVNQGVQDLLNGTYQPPAVQPAEPPPIIPAYRTVVVAANQKTLKDLADIHLDNENRWAEIWLLNRELVTNPNQLKPGMQIKIPNDLRGVEAARLLR